MRRARKQLLSAGSSFTCTRSSTSPIATTGDEVLWPPPPSNQAAAQRGRWQFARIGLSGEAMRNTAVDFTQIWPSSIRTMLRAADSIATPFIA